jgi:carboxyl-terminal processing protease
MISLLRLVLFGFTLIVSTYSFGIDEEGIAKRAKRLVEFFTEFHLQPRDLNDAFGRDVHTLLINTLDGDFMLFYQSDIDFLVAMSDSLDDQIQHKETRYIHELERILQERILEARKACQSALKDAETVLTRTGTYTASDKYPTNSKEFAQVWIDYTLKRLQEDVLSNVAEQADSEINWKSELAKSVESAKKRFSNYFDELSRTDDYFEMMYINSIAQCYDPHSSYFNESIREDFTQELSSERRVFGITYLKNDDGECEITGILPGSSAWFNEGIKIGDVLLKITESDGTTINPTQATRSEINQFFFQVTTDTIDLLVSSAGVKSKVTLVKTTVYSDEDIIKSAILSGESTNVGYISLPDFYTNWTDTSNLGCANDVAKSLMKLKRKDIDGLIIDLRNNGGGSVKEAIDLAGIFIDFGPIMTEQFRNGELYTSKDFNRGSIYSGPLMILVNSNSASASEIVGSTLQDYNRALIVGQPTYGKATSQTILPLDPYLNPFREEDASWGYAKVTGTGIYRLNNTSLQGIGITPDVVLPELSPFPRDYERDLPNVLSLKNIDKKMYYKPKADFPVAELREVLVNSQSPVIADLREVADSIRIVNDEINRETNLQKGLKLINLETELFKRYETLKKESEFAYKPVPAQFDESVLQLSPFLKSYNDAFMERLRFDVELNEAFKLIQQQIRLLK